MKIIRFLLFYPLLWMRGLFLAIGKILSFICVTSSALMGILKMTDQFSNIEWSQIIPLALVGFALFMLMEFYDMLLLKLNPTGATLTLHR